jgi:hypothetical protein
VRLLLWLDIWQLAGLPLGLLLAIQSALSPAFPRVRIVTRRSLWYTLDAGAAGRMLALPGLEPLPPTPYEQGELWPTSSPPAPPVERLRFSGLYERSDGLGNFDWDSHLPVPAQPVSTDSWVVIDAAPPTDWIHPDGAWGSDGVWGDGGAWGVDVAPATGQLLAEVVSLFKSAATAVQWIVVSFDASLFDPAQAAGGGINPDGHFARWSKIENGQYVSARFDAARYADGAG